MHNNSNVNANVDNYGTNLRHMAEPASPSERERAVSVSLEDYEALYLATMLREWSQYHAEGEDVTSIAMGYVEYINAQVRENGEHTVHLYAHTEIASEVVTNGMYEYHEAYRGQVPMDMFHSIEETIMELWGQQHAEMVNKDAGRRVYEMPPEDVEIEA